MRMGSSLANTTVVLSNEPCSFCVKALIQAGVSEILYLKRDDKEEADKEDLRKKENKKIQTQVMMAKTSYCAKGLSTEVCWKLLFFNQFY